MVTDRAELAANVTTARERVALSLGPGPEDDGSYWVELSEWMDWARWAPLPEDRVDLTPDWRVV